MKKLAFFGGEPVRTTPFPTNMIGASMIGQEELDQLADVVREKSPFRHYGVGNPQKTNNLEKEFTERFGVKYALAVSSGTAALLCAAAAANLGPGDEVIIPGFSWYSDYCALVTLGATPVFADIGEDLNLDPDSFESKITDKTKAVIVVHYQECPAKMNRIMEIARAHNLIVIEDCAQACGGSCRGKMLGTFGDIAMFSFQTHKIITCGEGGMVITNNEKMFVRAVRYHDLGFVRKAFADRLSDPSLSDEKLSFAGIQLRMNELSSAFLLAQLHKLDDMLKTCRKWHKTLREHTAAWKEVSVRFEEGDCGIAFVMMFPSKEYSEKFIKYMIAEGIPCQLTSACCNLMHKYPITSRALVHDMLPPFGPFFEGKDIVYDVNTDCPNTDGILERCAGIGIGPTYTQQEITDIISSMDKVYPQGKS